VVEVIFRKSFRHFYDLRIRPNTKLNDRFLERLKSFCKDPGNPVLQDHPLMGVMSKNRAFSITGDIRVIYRVVDDNTVEFFDIGTHNQVYK
jgi:addiction module RelE/StbE family toxin